MEHSILSEAYTKLAVLDLETGEEIAVVTNDDEMITTASEQYVVKLTPNYDYSG